MSGKLVQAVRAAVGPADGGPSDRELLRRFAATRDAGAFELLVWRHAGMVRAACRAVLRDRHLAEDASQAAFLALARRAAGVRENPAGWLYRVARRVAAKHRRAGGVSPLRECLPGEGVPSGGLRPPLAADEVAILHAELAALPDRYRLPVLLCFVEGLSHADAAARLGWPVGTVAGRIARAKATLRVRLARRGLAPALATLAVAGDGPFAVATSRLAVAFAAGESAGISPTVLTLTHGALRAMTVAKLKLAAGLVAACGALTAGGVWAGGQKPGAEAPAGGVAARQPGGAAEPEATAAPRRRSLTNLSRIAKAVADYEAANSHLPHDIVVRSADGKPPAGTRLLSWRVAVLPLLGRDDLYKRFRLNEPWDSPANKPLLAAIPPEYVTGTEPPGSPDTRYQVFVGPRTAFPLDLQMVLSGVLDGTANTLGVVEAGPPVPWTKPADLAYDPAKPLPTLDWPFASVAHVSTLDGVAFPLDPAGVSERVWRAWIDPQDGGDVADPYSARLGSAADTPEGQAALARLQAENAALVKELEAGWAKTAELLRADNARTRDPVLARRLQDTLKAERRGTEQFQKWLRERAEPAKP